MNKIKRFNLKINSLSMVTMTFLIYINALYLRVIHCIKYKLLTLQSLLHTVQYA